LLRAGEKPGLITADSTHSYYKADQIGLSKLRDEIAKASAKDVGRIYLKAEEFANSNNPVSARYWLNHANRLGYNANSNSRIANAISMAEQRIVEHEREQQRRRDSYSTSPSNGNQYQTNSAAVKTGYTVERAGGGLSNNKVLRFNGKSIAVLESYSGYGWKVACDKRRSGSTDFKYNSMSDAQAAAIQQCEH